MPESNTMHQALHQKLTELTSNLWWSWQPGVAEVFRAAGRAIYTFLRSNSTVNAIWDRTAAAVRYVACYKHCWKQNPKVC